MRKPTGCRAIFSEKLRKLHEIKDIWVLGKARALGASVPLGFPTDSSIIRARFVKLVEGGVLDPGRGVNADLFRTGCDLPLNCSSKLHEYVQN